MLYCSNILDVMCFYYLLLFVTDAGHEVDGSVADRNEE